MSTLGVRFLCLFIFILDVRLCFMFLVWDIYAYLCLLLMWDFGSCSWCDISVLVTVHSWCEISILDHLYISCEISMALHVHLLRWSVEILFIEFRPCTQFDRCIKFTWSSLKLKWALEIAFKYFFGEKKVSKYAIQYKHLEWNLIHIK